MIYLTDFLRMKFAYIDKKHVEKWLSFPSFFPLHTKLALLGRIRGQKITFSKKYLWHIEKGGWVIIVLQRRVFWGENARFLSRVTRLYFFWFYRLFLKDKWGFLKYLVTLSCLGWRIDKQVAWLVFELNAIFWNVSTFLTRDFYTGFTIFLKVPLHFVVHFIRMTSGCSSSDCRRDNQCFHIHIA